MIGFALSRAPIKYHLATNSKTVRDCSVASPAGHPVPHSATIGELLTTHPHCLWFPLWTRSKSSWIPSQDVWCTKGSPKGLGKQKTKKSQRVTALSCATHKLHLGDFFFHKLIILVLRIYFHLGPKPKATAQSGAVVEAEAPAEATPGSESTALPWAGTQQKAISEAIKALNALHCN